MPNTAGTRSEFYPPRANRFSLLRSQYFIFRRHQVFEGPWLSKLKHVHTAIALIIPGTVFLPFKQGRAAAFFAGWVAALAMHVAFLGGTLSTLGMLIMSGIQGTCITATLRGKFNEFRDGQRPILCAGFACLLTLVTLNLLQTYVIARYVVRVNTPESVLINPSPTASNFRRMDWVAYSTPRIRGGVGFDQILACPGDIVEFFPEHFEINGVPFHNLRREMPTSGRLIVPANSFFIWPNAAYGRSADWVLNHAAVVPVTAITGVAYQHWFWKTQRFEPAVVRLRN